MSIRKRLAEGYAEANVRAARIILDAPDRHGIGLVQWARAVMAKVQAVPPDVEAGPLFAVPRQDGATR